MGTLFDQRPRRYFHVDDEDVDTALFLAKELADKYGVNVGDVIAMRAVLEQERAGNISVANGDAWDEQIAGIGELIRELNSNICSLLENLQ